MTRSIVESTTKVIVDLAMKAPIRILHVDDEAEFLKAAKSCLEMEGAFQVDVAVSVEEALEKIKKKKFDVIVADYKMPEKDGLQFLKELREKGNSIPFIMFTGKGREEIAIKALNYGADQYLNKTGDPETVYGELTHSIRKVTERKRAEERLGESEQKYKSLFENAKDVIVLLDLKGNVTSVNKAAVKYGFREDEIIGKNMLKFVPKKYWPRLLKELTQIARGKPNEGEIEINTPKGKKIAWYRSNLIIMDNKVGGIQTILRDNTERKRTEEALREMNTRLQTLIHAIPDVVYFKDAQGRNLVINRAFEKLVNLEKEEIVGKTDEQLFSPDLAEHCRKSDEEVLRKRKILRFKEETIGKKGNKRVFDTIKAPLFDVQGNVVGLVGVSRDITEHKEAEETLG